MEKIEYFRNSFYKIIARPVPDQCQISAIFFGKNIIWHNLRSHPLEVKIDDVLAKIALTY
jgi:hypothetical protein